MLEALARNFPPILKNTPPLYDFLTQLAAFDSPIASFLDEEMRTFKNFPMTCQSLQSVASYLKFDWNTPHKFRELFKARLFDYLGKLDIDGTPEWFTRRSRFASSVPLEYAYAAWGQLPKPAAGKGDEFADFQAMTKDLLVAFETRRLEALENVAGSIQGNPNTQKTAFVLPDLDGYEDMAQDLTHALHEFVTIERLVALNDWKSTRHAPPARRVLMSEALLVRYCEADQEPGVAEQNRENERRRRKREEYAAAFKASNPDKQFRLNKEQQVYESLFDTLRAQNPPMIRFAESFRLHAAMAEFLRQEVYRHDGIAYYSKQRDQLPAHPLTDDTATRLASSWRKWPRSKDSGSGGVRMMYDFIGDVHGHADELIELLEALGYEKMGGTYRHPDRKVIFLGDFIDRGPPIRQALEIVRPMIEAGHALAVMENHELNALAYHTEDRDTPGRIPAPPLAEGPFGAGRSGVLSRPDDDGDEGAGDELNSSGTQSQL